MIVIKGVKKSFGDKVVVDIDNYEIRDGEILGIVGNNGAGKTTLFRLVLDLLKLDSGEVVNNGHIVSATDLWKDFTTAYVDESFLINYLTPEEFFNFLTKVYGIDKEELNSRLAVFERFMSGEIMGQKKYIRNYSMGNKQKIGIISAMLANPKVLILDEPFNFLDPTSQSILKQLLVKYAKENNATVIISTHNIDHIAHICSRIALMEEGRIIRDIENKDASALRELKDYFCVEEEVTT